MNVQIKDNQCFKWAERVFQYKKFENELDPDVVEPTTDEYEDEKDNIDDEEDLEEPEGEEEELEL